MSLLTLAIVFFVIAILAYVLGARGVAGMSAGIGRTLLFVFIGGAGTLAVPAPPGGPHGFVRGSRLESTTLPRRVCIRRRSGVFPDRLPSAFWADVSYHPCFEWLSSNDPPA
jgi:uncharacterized membrane protein YtjA (UPF0391 family)